MIDKKVRPAYNATMVRLNLNLTQGLAARLRRLAQDRGVAVSALVRDLAAGAELPLGTPRDVQVAVTIDDDLSALLSRAVQAGRYRHQAEVLRELLEALLGADGDADAQVLSAGPAVAGDHPAAELDGSATCT